MSVSLQTCYGRWGRYKLPYMYRFKQNVKLYWCSSIEYSKWHHCTDVNPHREYFDQVKNKIRLLSETIICNYLSTTKLLEYNTTDAMFCWVPDPSFWKKGKVWITCGCTAWSLKSLLSSLIYLPWVSRLHLQTFLASRIGCKTTIFPSLHQWHTDHRLSWGWGEGNVGNQTIPLGLSWAALFDYSKHLRPDVHTGFLFQMESLLLMPPVKAWSLKHYLWGVL